MARMQGTKSNTAPDTRTVSKKTPNKLGLFQVYDSIRHPHAAYILCKEHGFMNIQLAEVFGVTESVISSWKNKYPGFERSINDGIDYFNSNVVEKTLLQTALGFDYEETSITEGFDKNGNLIETKSVSKKKALPNVKAITYWLNNRRKDRWKNESSINAKIEGEVKEVKTQVKLTADLSKMSVEQLKNLRQIIQTHKENEPIELNTTELEVDEVLQIAGKSITDADYVNV